MRTILLLLILISATGFAQPVIRYMQPHELEGTLHIQGNFPSSASKVFVDSVQCAVLSYSDTLLIVGIPDSGKGSVGGVEIEVNGVRTEPRYLTEWRVISDWYARTSASTTNYDTVYIRLDLRFRLDIHSLCRSNFFNSVDLFFDHQPARSTCYQKMIRFTDGVPDTDEVYISKYMDGSLEMYAEGVFRIFSDPYPYGAIGRFNNYFASRLDGKFKIDTGFYQGIGFVQTWSPVQTKFDAPDKALILLYPTRLREPTGGAHFVPTTNALFTWRDMQFPDSVKLIDSFQIQISTDSLFMTLVADTVITGLEYTMPSLTKDTRYFWRVSGMNSEGRSRWSAYRKFTTDVQVSVPFVKEGLSGMTLFPNPATREVMYRVNNEVVDAAAEISIITLLGEEIYKETIHSSNGTLNIGALASGRYIVVYHSADSRFYQMLQIVK